MRKIYSLYLTCLFLCCVSAAAWGASPLTVAGDGTQTTSQYHPFYGAYCDQYVRSQMIYPSSMLTTINGKQIDGMSFYLKAALSDAWTSNFQVYLSEVSATNYDESSVWNTESVTSVLVYEGTLSGTTGMVPITFTTSYVYKGGNLMVEVKSTSKGNYPNAYFNGKSMSNNTSVYGKNANSTTFNANGRSKFLAKVDITYSTPSGGSTCTDPSALAISSLSSTSATFTWTAGASETSWQYICLPAASTVDWTSASVQTANTTPTATVTGLSPETNYKFHVRAYCGASDQSTGINKAFKTPCVGVDVSGGWSESFTGLTTGSGIIPDCWGSATYTGGGYTYPYVIGSNASDGDSRSLAFNGGTSGVTTCAILPPFEQAIKDLCISFDYKNGAATEWYPQQFSVGYVTNPEDMSTYVNVQTFPQSTDYVSTDDINFPSTVPLTATNIVIRYAGNKNYATSAYVDNIRVGLQSSCAKPTGLSAVAASASSINLSWTKGDSETKWNAQYRIGSGAWTAVNNISTTVSGTTCSATLTGLTAETTYEIQVQADCGGSTSNWSTSATETTPCVAVNGLGFTQNFESESTGLGVLPACWQGIGGNYPYVNNSSYYRITGSNYLYFYGGTTDVIAILPPFTNVADLYVTFNYKYYYQNASYGKLQVGYITNPKNAATFTSLQEFAITTDVTKAETPMTGAPAGSYVAIRFGGGSSSGTVMVDDIEITAIPSCMPPTDAAGVATAYNQASISWTSDASEWKLQYSADNGANWTNANGGNSITSNPYTLTGLSGNTDYIVRVKAVCGSDESDWSANSAAFPTPCAPADASDYNETFESSATGSGNLPDCWDYIQSATVYSTKYPYVLSGSTNAYAGSKSLYFYGGLSSSEQIVRLPKMDRAIKDLTISFYYKSPESAYSVFAKLTVGYIAADGVTFNPIETLDYTDDYTFYEKELASAAADASYIAIRFAGSASSSASAYVDNIHIEPSPTCIKPAGVAASNMTSNSAQISWTEKNGKSAWKLQYSTDGTNWTNANSGNNITSNPYTLTGLSGNTLYYARVKTDCGSGDLSEWSAASEPFRTECDAVSSLPWNENFSTKESGKVPTCWEAVDANKTNYPSITVSASGNSYLSLSDNGLFFNGNNANYGYIKFPTFDAALSTLQISFKHKAESTSSSGKIELGYFVGEVFTLLKAYDQAAVWNTETPFKLTDVPAGARLAFRYKANSSSDYAAAVDDITIEEIPSCANPTTFEVDATSIGTNSASLSWTSAAANFALQYSTDGSSWTDATAPITNPYILSGLTENTLYYARVKAVCGTGNESGWVELAAPFRTDCDPKAVTWNEGFEGATVDELPSCWATPTADNSYDYAKVISSEAKTGDKCLVVRAYGAYSKIVELPVFDSEIKNLQIIFDYKNSNTNSNYGQLEVGYYSASTFTRVGEALPKTDNAYGSSATTVEMPSNAPDGARIAFRVVGIKSNYYTYAYIDNIEVALKLTCKAPVNVQRTALTNEGATFTWEASDLGETQYDYACVIADAVLTDGDWNTLTDGLRTVTLTGKTANQAYDFYVRSHCGSAPTAKQTFTPTCLAPTDLAASTITSTSATISWTGNAKAVHYKASDAADWTKETISGTSYNFSGVASTTYLVQVQAACAIEDDEAWTASLEFTTKCAPLTISAAVPYTNDFESETTGALPACWDRVSATAYPQVVSGSAAYGADEYTDKKCVCFYASGEQYLVLPAFTPATVDELSISFWYRNSSSTLTLGYMEADGTTFHSIEALENRSAYGDNIYELELTGAPAEAAYIAIQYIGTGDLSNAYVDEFTVRYTPTCKKPTDLTALTANITSNSAQLSWTETGTATAWNIQYQLAPATDWTAATSVAVTTNPYTLTGLAEGTSYVARVQADCGAGDENKSDWSDETTFTTHCAAITAIPFTEDFNAALNHCWELHPEDPTYYAAYVSGGRLVLPGGKEGAGHVVVMPEISADLSNATFSIRYSIASDAETPEVGYITTPGDVTSFVALETLSKSATIARIALNTLPVEAKNLAIRYDGTGSIERDFSIDEIRISHVEVFADDASITDNSSRLTALAGGTMDVILERSLARTGNYASLSLPFALSAEQLADTKCPLNGFVVREYDHAEVDRTSDIVDIYLRTVNAVEAGKAYFVRYDGTADALQPMEFRDVTVAGSTIVPTEDGCTLTLYPVFDPFPLEANNEATLYLSTNNLLYYPTAAGYIKGFRAYFNIPAGSVMMPVIRRGAVVRISEGHSTPTEMKNVQTTGNNVLKRIENNQVLIIRNGVKYTIQGQKLQ